MVTVLLAACIGGVALRARAAVEAPPAFEEVFSLVRSNLAGANATELDQLAVEGLVNELSPRVMLVSNANASVWSDVPGGVIEDKIYRKNVAYIRLGAIREGTSQQVQADYHALASTNELLGLVLDLRRAGGDDYAEALQVADLFLGHEVPLVNWGEGLKRSRENADAIMLPVAVLVDGQTGGAAEALAAMLRQSGVALLLGSRTAGTAGVQRTFPLNNGQFLKITVANIQLGDAQMLSSAGLKPDVQVADATNQVAAPSSGGGDEETRGRGEAEASTNSTSPRMGMNEADLVRRWRGEMLSAKDFEIRPAESGPESMDPALLRALDLMDGLAILRSWQR